jgi:hypothetical protein
MSTQNLTAWLSSLLKQKLVPSPDGRPLFAYDLSPDDYIELGHQLAGAVASAGGIAELAEISLGRPPIFSPPAAFVLYASEWWKREYAGGAWSWSPIVNALGPPSDSFSQLWRSRFVARGLAFWGLATQDRGKTYIGPIVTNSGIPMRLLATGSGAVATLLGQVLKQAGRFGWSLAQIQGAVAERQFQLPAAYRQQPLVAELLARFVEAALHLRDEYQLQGVTDPVARLDQVYPDWRRRFPVALESEAAQSLLTGMVREAAVQGSGTTQGLFLAERRLVRDFASGPLTIVSHVTCPSRIAAEDLASMFGISDVEALPRAFTIDLEAETRQPCIEGRLIFGSEKPTAILTARRMVVRNQSARSDLQLIMRSQAGDMGERCTLGGGGALPDDDPWIFVEDEAGHHVLAAAGGARLPQQSAWVALPPGWIVESETPAETLGELLSPGLPARQLLCLRSDARLVLPGITFRVRLGQVAPPGQIFQWKAQRLPEARGRSVFRDRQPPRLFRTTEEGLQALPLSTQQWRRPGTQELLNPREARGPVEVSILDECEVVARQRIFVLSPEARIEYVSGNVVGTGSVRFVNWGGGDLAPEIGLGVSVSVINEGGNAVRIELSSSDSPPSEFRVRLRWPGTVSELSLFLPYPVSGGRFLRSNGTVMQANERLTLRELVGIRLQIFDTNPAHPKRYEIQLAMGQSHHQVSSRYPIALLPGVGRAEVRLIDFQKQIESLLGLFDDLDAKVRIGLVVGGQCTSEIIMGRYTTSLHADQDSVRVPEAAMALISPDGLESMRVLASPLIQPGVAPLELVPVRTEGVHTGAWAAQGMVPDLAPWLVYPAENSAILFRPMVWVESGSRDASEDSSDSAAVEVSTPSLPAAMAVAQEAARKRQVHSALVAMSENHQSDSWPLLDSLWETFHHLPLTALDVWRLLAKQPKAVLSFLLRSELDETALAEAVRRFRTETGWAPELTTVSDLCEVAQAFWRFWLGQGLDRDRCQKYFKDELESRLKLLANEIPSLRPLIESVIFAATGTMSDLLLEVAGSSRKATPDFLRELWDGSDSLVNSQLFLVNAEREISTWPGRDFIQQQAFPAFATACTTPNQQLLMPYFKKMFWPQLQDRKFSVANLPVLCALWAATSTSRQWWSEPGRRLMLKQIRDFDPIWFEQAYRQAFKVCMSIDGLVQLPEITVK